MSCFVILDENGIVTGRRGGPYAGHIEAPEWVECGDALVAGVWKKDDSKRIAAIKAEAGRIIESKFPLTTQLNMLARYSELCGRFVILPYTAEAEEKAKLEEAYDWIKAVRAESNRLEKDASAKPEWPE